MFSKAQLKNIFQEIYKFLPVFLQNISVSLYGLHVKREQVGRGETDDFKEINSRLEKTAAEIETQTNKNLRRVLENAAKNIPFYQELFRTNHIDINEITSPSDLRKLPVLEKASIKARSDAFLDATLQKKHRTINTTGTTGTPLRIYYTKDDRQRSYAFYERYLKSIGINTNGRRATFGGRIIVSQSQQKPPFWRYSLFQKNLLMSSYHICENTVASYADVLKKFKPDYIESYPSAIYILAKLMRNRGIDGRGITNAIVTSAETLMSEQRREIEEVFGITVYDHYGSAEMCVFIAQCRFGNYHIHSDYGIVELINEKGDVAAPGEAAELICTGLVNTTMPLIRYRIGDRCIVSDNKCDCGLPFPVIENILGRIDDVICTPDGRKISRFGSVFHDQPIRELQIRQAKPTQLHLHIVPEKKYDERTEDEIRRRLCARLGDKIEIQFHYESKIVRGAGGKLRMIVSDLK